MALCDARSSGRLHTCDFPVLSAKLHWPNTGGNCGRIWRLWHLVFVEVTLDWSQARVPARGPLTLVELGLPDGSCVALGDTM